MNDPCVAVRDAPGDAVGVYEPDIKYSESVHRLHLVRGKDEAAMDTLWASVFAGLFRPGLVLFDDGTFMEEHPALRIDFGWYRRTGTWRAEPEAIGLEYDADGRSPPARLLWRRGEYLYWRQMGPNGVDLRQVRVSRATDARTPDGPFSWSAAYAAYAARADLPGER